MLGRLVDPNLIELPNLPSIKTSPSKGNKGLIFSTSIKLPLKKLLFPSIAFGNALLLGS